MEKVFALDIGVYGTGSSGQILSGTTAAWCRLERGITDIGSLIYGGTATFGQFAAPHDSTLPFSCVCGRSIEKLAELIAADLSAGHRVALGFEAPMWLPLEHRHKPRLKLFGPRFQAEAGSEWYLQSGAAATLKAISLGVMLREHLRDCHHLKKRTTHVDFWQPDTLLLFEAFVVGPFKTLGVKAADAAPNEWDAFTAALAWGALHLSFITSPTIAPILLHRTGAREGSCLSVWDVIFGDLLPPFGSPDCDVVAMRSANAT
jgi:hypothetical protein